MTELKRKLFLFNSNGESGIERQWCHCFAIADDGHVLGDHLCSHPNFMKGDLHDRRDKKIFIDHFGSDDYEIIELWDDNEIERCSEFKVALELNKQLGIDYRRTANVILYTEEANNDRT